MGREDSAGLAFERPMLLIFRTSLIGRKGRDDPVRPPFEMLSCSWAPVWLVPFEVGQMDGLAAGL